MNSYWIETKAMPDNNNRSKKEFSIVFGLRYSILSLYDAPRVLTSLPFFAKLYERKKNRSYHA
jgi:hypothetical protein